MYYIQPDLLHKGFSILLSKEVDTSIEAAKIQAFSWRRTNSCTVYGGRHQQCHVYINSKVLEGTSGSLQEK